MNNHSVQISVLPLVLAWALGAATPVWAVGPTSDCKEVRPGLEVKGAAPVQVEKWTSGLEVPWGLGFLPTGEALVTERPGRVRLVKASGELVTHPVVTIEVGERGEGGLLGLAIDPKFSAKKRPYFYVFYTTTGGMNRVVRYQLSADLTTATVDKVIIKDFLAGTFHNGGRLRFGPDGNLYVGTGDGRNAPLAQDINSLNGKILRVTADGEIPADNPFPGKPTYIYGLRNVEGFDWLDRDTMMISDHGPTGEVNGWSGYDELNVARAGMNLGWPVVHGCDSHEGMVAPLMTWKEALPPGGAVLYHGDSIPEWKGTYLIGVLGFAYENARRLSQIMFQYQDRVAGGAKEQVYFYGAKPVGYGRLRDVVEGPGGALFVTTSNCDGRGDCGPEKDQILKMTGSSATGSGAHSR